MKVCRIICIILLALTICSCASTKIGTLMGKSIGNSFVSSAASGVAAAPAIIKAWPYISGMIKGNPKYKNVEKPAIIDLCVNRLDVLAKQATLTDEDCGEIMILLVQLELEGEAWFLKTYGTSIYNLYTTYAGGGL